MQAMLSVVVEAVVVGMVGLQGGGGLRSKSVKQMQEGLAFVGLLLAGRKEVILTVRLLPTAGKVSAGRVAGSAFACLSTGVVFGAW